MRHLPVQMGRGRLGFQGGRSRSRLRERGTGFARSPFSSTHRCASAESRVMIRHLVAAGLLVAAATVAGGAEAKGCIKGALVGGLAGHVAGHGAVGAAAGCAIGRHRANKRDRNQAQQGQDAH